MGGQDGGVDQGRRRPRVSRWRGRPGSGGRTEVPRPVEMTREPEGTEGEVVSRVVETRVEGGRNIW